MNDFNPDWASPPGDTIADLMEEQSISLESLAHATGQPLELLSQVLSGSAPISEAMAESLSQVLGASVEFWLRRESQYQEALSRVIEKNRELYERLS